MRERATEPEVPSGNEELKALVTELVDVYRALERLRATSATKLSEQVQNASVLLAEAIQGLDERFTVLGGELLDTTEAQRLE